MISRGAGRVPRPVPRYGRPVASVRQCPYGTWGHGSLLGRSWASRTSGRVAPLTQVWIKSPGSPCTSPVRRSWTRPSTSGARRPKQMPRRQPCASATPAASPAWSSGTQAGGAASPPPRANRTRPPVAPVSAPGDSTGAGRKRPTRNGSRMPATAQWRSAASSNPPAHTLKHPAAARGVKPSSVRGRESGPGTGQAATSHGCP
jgi:hypothetical protein